MSLSQEGLDQLRKNVATVSVDRIVGDTVGMFLMLTGPDALAAFGSEAERVKVLKVTAQRMLAALDRDADEVVRLQQEGDALIRSALKLYDA